MWKYIVSITGNTATGTTTLAERLSQLREWQVTYSESYIENSPFFTKFLRNPRRWAFHNQAFFITEYIEMYQKITRSNEETGEILCLDYTVFELDVYTHAMRRRGLIDQGEYDVLSRMVELLRPDLLAPSLLIYLSAGVDALMQRISNRNRTDEKSIDRAYIEALQTSFHSFIGSWDRGPVLWVDSEREDFLNDDDTVMSIADRALSRIK